jgi:hypothetical protein
VARVSVTSPVGVANSPIVHFLGNGRWVVYATTAANGSLRGPFVMPVTGGRARAPLGSGLVAFTWAPDGSRLYGITAGGELVSAAPTGGRRIVAAGLGSAAGAFPSLAISPDGRDAGVEISRCGAVTATELLTVNLRTGSVRTALRRTGDYATLAGWSPNGRWLLYWPQSICSASLAADGFALYAVAAGGGAHPMRAVAHTLLYPDFLAWCAGRLIAASTPDRETELDGKLCCRSQAAISATTTTSSGPQRSTGISRADRRGPRHEETMMPTNLPHDGYTQHELGGGRS